MLLTKCLFLRQASSLAEDDAIANQENQGKEAESSSRNVMEIPFQLFFKNTWSTPGKRRSELRLVICEL